MMGRRTTGQGQLFYAFALDEVVPASHLVRKIDSILDLSWVHQELAPFYSSTGRPSIDPELMLRMLILGYIFAIRSERQICAEVQVNLAYRWFCRLSIEDEIPNHSVFSRARHERFRESDVLRGVLERIVGASIAAGLVGGDAFSVDASLIKADVNERKRASARQRPAGKMQIKPLVPSGSTLPFWMPRPTSEAQMEAATGAAMVRRARRFPRPTRKPPGSHAKGSKPHSTMTPIISSIIASASSSTPKARAPAFAKRLQSPRRCWDASWLAPG
jgi:transposase